MKKIMAMLPYLESEELLELAKEIVHGNIEMDISELLVFMDEEDVDKLCEELSNNPQLMEKVKLSDMYPYASEEYVDKLFVAQAKQGKIDTDALPYVSDDGLHQFALMYSENPDANLDIDDLYQYLDSEDIALLFHAYLKMHKKNT